MTSSHNVRVLLFGMSISMQPASGKQAAKVEDDDIVAGPQKTSLKCPVRVPATLAVADLNALDI